MVPDSTGSDGYLPSFSRFDEDGHFHAEALLDEMVMDGTEHQQCAQRDPAQSLKKKTTNNNKKNKKGWIRCLDFSGSGGYLVGPAALSERMMN